MKKLALLVALVLAFSLSVLAQGTSATGTQESQTTTTTKTKKAKKGTAATEGETAGATKGAKEHQLTGCLAKDPSGSGFMLTNGHYKKGVEVKSSEDLSAHVGHEVKLTGTWEKPTAGAEGGAGAKGTEMRTFNASALKHISDTCTAAGKAGKASKKGKTEAAPKS